jgi:hypothetical protein
MRSEGNYPKNGEQTVHENAPTHLSVLVKDFLTKNNMTTLEYPQYIPDLTPLDIYTCRVL